VYELHPDLEGVATNEWLRQHVVPPMSRWYNNTDDPSLTLALPLLWASFDKAHELKQVQHQRESICLAFNAIRPAGFEANPVVKTPLTIWCERTELRISKVTIRRPEPPSDNGDAIPPTANAVLVPAAPTPPGAAMEQNHELMMAVMSQYQHLVNSSTVWAVAMIRAFPN
jgi:hypothetical protein